MSTTTPRAETALASGEEQPETRRVVVTFSIAPRQMASFQAQLGPRYKVLDVYTAVKADIVICPPCSVRTIEKLQRQYPTAAIVVVEPDAGSGALDAPVTRLLAAGAAAYVADPSSEALASTVHRLRTTAAG
jgi:hypothetical protein